MISSLSTQRLKALNPKPQALNPASCFPRPRPRAGQPSTAQKGASSHQGFGFELRILEFRAPGLEFWGLELWGLESTVWFRVLEPSVSWLRMLGFRFQCLGSRIT